MATTEEAIKHSDATVLAVWMPVVKDIIAANRGSFTGNTIIHPTNNIGLDGQGAWRSLNPEGRSAGQQVVAMLPPGAHYVKAFGTLTTEALAARAASVATRWRLFTLRTT